MRTRFTKEEMYEVYSTEVVNILIEDFQMSLTVARKHLERIGLKDDFINHMEDYQFVEPYKIVREILEENN